LYRIFSVSSKLEQIEKIGDFTQVIVVRAFEMEKMGKKWGEKMGTYLGKKWSR